MSSRDAHLDAARTNASIATQLRREGSDRLVVVPTLAFYTAVQLIEAALAALGEHPFSHQDRKIALVSRWRAGAAPYENLKQLSESWRYKAMAPSADEVGRAFRWLDDVAAAVGEASPLGRT